MTFALKTTNVSRSQPWLKISGYSGAIFIFKWDGILRAYVYVPKNQKEVDDIVRTMSRTTVYIFAPHQLEHAPEKPVEPATPPEPTLPVAVDSNAIEAAALRGIQAVEGDTTEHLERLVKAFDDGSKSALALLPKARNRPNKPPATTQPPAEDEAPLQTATVPVT